MNSRYLISGLSLVALSASAQIQLVKDFGATGTDPFPTELTPSGGLVFFKGFDAATGWEPWVSDGTLAGTVMVKDINPGPTGSLFQPWFTDVDGVLYFGADDGASGTELWKSDGTEAGTVLVKDINPGTNSSNPSFTINYNSSLLFSATDAIGTGLWKSDGSGMGTMNVIMDFSPYATMPVIMNGFAFFNAYANTIGDYTLWSSNGTTLLTLPVLPPGGGGPGGSFGLTPGDALIYFESSSINEGAELWRSDGSGIGTLVADINPGSAGCNLRNITTIGDTAYFNASDGVNGNGLYRFRPGQATEHISTVIPQYYGSVEWPYMVAMNGTLYFVGYDPATGAELYKSDGTTAGTVLVKDINPGTNNGLGELSYLKVVGDSLYFLADAPGTGAELWVSDGTEAGTVMVQDRNLGSSSFYPSELTQVGNTLYMRGTGAGPNQLYKLDLDWSTPTNELPEQRLLRAWPSPTDGLFHLEGILVGDRLRVYDITGRELPWRYDDGLRVGTVSIHLPRADAGVLVIQVVHPDNTTSELRVMVQ